MSSRILVLTNDVNDADVLTKVLRGDRSEPFDVESLRSLGAGIDRLRQGGIDAVVVNLGLPDSQGLATFEQLHAAAPHTPIVALSAANDEAPARQAVQRGAHAYLTKGHFDCGLVPQTLRNIMQRKAIEAAFYTEKARAEIALNSISDAVICTDLSGRVNYLNIAAEAMTGWSREEARGQAIENVFRIINGVTRQADFNPVELVLQRDEVMGLKANTVLVRRDGSEAAIEDSASPIHDWDGHITGAVIVFHDISAAKAMTLKMAHLAQHDFLTGLPNRMLLNDRIAQAVTLAKRHNTHLAVLFLDLDNFKTINDSLGHATGDQLLQSVTTRLNACVRSSDTVSRQGGDEFVILLAEGGHEESAALTAGKILAALAKPHAVGDSALHVNASIGISVYPADGLDAEALIKSADTAMYHAKGKGRNNYQFFTSDMNRRAVERQLVESHLRRALDRQEFVLHYQPKVNLATGRVTGAEALLRWRHPDWGLVLPDRFVPVAEDCGLIVPIGRWVLREACGQAQRWIESGLALASIAVNISALEFHQAEFAQALAEMLKQTGLPAHRLQLEITEGGLMRDAKASAKILRELKSMGVQLAVDDFGTGYSSLSYLNQFPIDILKIDQSFVQDIKCADDTGIIVSAVIGMGNNLKLQVVAEGVENQVQLDFLTTRQCDEAQGYLFSRPLAAEQFADILVNGMPARLGNEPKVASCCQ
ncbi:putative bifunctional diguanylate cyclase/phosphodiesterase [Rhodoferax sp.]|uniref:putative bifunctional diguanylate cyclase/phosphodiesterase n=1 Tax=Rhodoferax sp. TaxID=50421 RepID=UPI00276FB9B8|nr:EAL domain-containing protein [Rhodoferax sp.]